MQKGINLATFYFNQAIAKAINESGLPPCVLRSSLAEIIEQVGKMNTIAIENERKALEAEELLAKEEGEKNGEEIL